MKKLLLLLFLIPNLVMGESFLLICDVDKYSEFFSRESTTKDTIAVKVEGEFIRVDGKVYKTSKRNKQGNYISYYELGEDMISWGSETDETERGLLRAEGNINRLSGKIDFMKGSFNAKSEVVYRTLITGKCTKKEKAF